MNKPKYMSEQARAYISELEKEIDSLKYQLSVKEKALEFERKAHLFDCKRWSEERTKNEQGCASL